MERSTTGYDQRIQVGMMHAANQVESYARLMGVEFAPSGQPTRHVRPLAKPTRRRASNADFVSKKVRKYPEKNSVYLRLSRLEIDQGNSLFGKFLNTILALIRSILASLRPAVLQRPEALLRPLPLMLRHRELLVSVNRAAFSQGASQNLSTHHKPNHRSGDDVGLRFAQIRELALSQQSGDAATIHVIGQQFRAMRHQSALSRRDAAQRLGCTEEQILVLENGYGNLSTSCEMLDRLKRVVNLSP